MLHELDILEARRIAELAAELRRVRDRLLEKVRETELGVPEPARGEHDPAARLALEDVLAREPAAVALRQAIEGLPRDIRDRLWAVMRIGAGAFGITGLDAAVAEAAAMAEQELLARLMADPDLHDHLAKGLYELGAAAPGEGGGG